MSKGMTSAIIMCPCCKLEYDSEARTPFVGSCGHSLCSNCAIKKEITTCPTCEKQGECVTKRGNESSAESVAVQMDSEENSVPAILKPEFFLFLYQVINQLDRNSFVKLARSCKQLFDVCYKSSEIKIFYSIPIMQISTDQSASLFFRLLGPGLPDVRSIPLDYSGDQKGFLGSVENRKKLKGSPFRFKLLSLWIMYIPLTENSIAEIRSFLSEFSIKSIPKMQASDVVDWKDFIQFVKDFRSEDVEVHNGDSEETTDIVSSVPEEAATYLVQNFDRFRTDMIVSDSAILNASAARLYLLNAAISQETFLVLLKKLANSTKDFVWKIGRQSFEFGHYDIFAVTDIYDDGPLPETRPLIVLDRDAGRCKSFGVLRKDGKIMKCIGSIHSVVFCSSLEEYDLEIDNEFDFFPVF